MSFVSFLPILFHFVSVCLISYFLFVSVNSYYYSTSPFLFGYTFCNGNGVGSQLFLVDYFALLLTMKFTQFEDWKDVPVQMKSV